jgi:hypothetical protein
MLYSQRSRDAVKRNRGICAINERRFSFTVFDFAELQQLLRHPLTLNR